LTNKVVQNFDRDLAGFHKNKRQMEAIKVLSSGDVKFFLYGGALGGGKSYLLRWYCVRYLLNIFKKYGLKDIPVMLACEDYPSLKDRQISKIGREFPEWMGKSYGDHGEYGRCYILSPEYTGGIICFRNLDDPAKYQSSEFALIAVDELTKNDYDTFTQLRMRNRWPGIPDIDCQFIGGTNPGGIGHGWVKALWIDRTFGSEWYPPESAIDYRKQFAFVKSKATDNPFLDAGYHSVLSTLPKSMRQAFRDGRWDIFIGQAFPDFEPSIHVIRPIPIPAYAQLYMTFDWGYGKPFSVGWWWVDMEGVVYRFAEWYGWDGTPDIGLRLADEEMAKGIVAREKKMGIDKKSIIRLCDPTCFNKKPDYQGGGQGPSTAEVFARFNVIMGKGDPSRKLKLRQFHQRLQTKDEEGNPVKPMFHVYDNCEQFIRTIPNIVAGKTDIEDIDTTGEDHIYDEAAHIVMARPLSFEIPPERKDFMTRRIEKMEKEATIDDYIDDRGMPGLALTQRADDFYEDERGDGILIPTIN